MKPRRGPRQSRGMANRSWTNREHAYRWVATVAGGDPTLQPGCCWSSHTRGHTLRAGPMNGQPCRGFAFFQSSLLIRASISIHIQSPQKMAKQITRRSGLNILFKTFCLMGRHVDVKKGKMADFLRLTRQRGAKSIFFV